ncbi:glucans biosynthesis protein MdoC [Serratia fonticola]|jgi:glucan biosynthesis protein C|uniref:glucans biosynthesis protein MdoC n=1 Tax=Serratia fonticola TaxID=47917 RepID=UPI0003FE1B06|nr:glucans biosynthesis protein MdoC [Serratia fonticola]MDQ7207277.1 glucans biosynthesis protein MdoC [Serratia fonticola]OKP26395.1 glucan biosynthesis protein C [Serratia fonticola]CAI2132749.1 Glucans biosynthesis protein C [Serratia fonticola]HBE9077511.1 glucans biosynthesis protein MdoC [Serratia fonticola]HBE9088081.1 glucans biosynthesis protein MdoC [Serratia fonticola]
MTDSTNQREFFLDSIRAYLMLLGIPFHLSLIYSSHSWAVNSATPSFSLTVLNDFIHAFRMQVFFIISGYFSYMLYERYDSHRWLKVRLERVAIPLLSSIPLITLPQFFLLKNYTDKLTGWDDFTPYQKINVAVWELVSHLWFLLTLCLLTCACFYLFKKIKAIKTPMAPQPINKMTNLSNISLWFLLYAFIYCVFHRIILITAPHLLSNGLFNFVVMETLFYLPFFIVGAYAFKYPWLKAVFLKPSWPAVLGSLLLFVAYMLNQKLLAHSSFGFELEIMIKAVLGVLMANVVFAFGHALLDFHSPRITYLVNASLFIYLVHHPLTLIYGAFMTPLIDNNLLGFLLGLVFVFACAFLLYELHKRIPLLRFLFSGKA